MTIRITHDFTKFLNGLNTAKDAYFEAAKDTFLEDVGPVVVNDAVTKDPKPFLDTGFLQGSSAIGVSNRPVVENPNDTKTVPEDPTSGRDNLPFSRSGFKKIELRVAFTAQYARFLHDNPDAIPQKISQRKDVKGNRIVKKASMAGRGAYWLSSKFQKFTNKVYVPILAKGISRRMAGRKF
ncbi:hypothetical protein FH593_20645 (plasmid) [Leptospira interrogans]|uniref:hypothetical protein n=1 Tax=Leptospira interrogans TaxID=173 RepID=UPI0002BFD646|nr:hypothetical protein [Leptospira interrogans]EMN60350.1 hypothetical protein LEP1GSC092_0027 [Leptospira interrogans serovar Pyrogenes str. R168]ULG90653.1 hypothetical protein FH593_20645 [Leptospira interrogans]UML78419.1 hypothetical protein FH583_21750 [Leptospira interrogans]